MKKVLRSTRDTNKRRKVTVDEKKKEETPCWSSLPLELMENIMTNLYYVDHVHVKAVCNGWRSKYIVPPLKQLPWLMAFPDNTWSSCKLFDPVYKKTYSVNVAEKRLRGKNFDDIQIHTCKQGWLLMSLVKKPKCLFLYSPFLDGRIIDLPPLNSTFEMATFSSPPSNSDCVVFTLDAPEDSKTVYIRTCDLNNKKWITRVFRPSNWMFFGCNSVNYMDGTFYCLSKSGLLGTYNMQDTPSWREFSEQEFQIINPKATSVHTVVFDGKIMLIAINWQVTDDNRFQIYRLDRTDMTWYKIRSIDDQVLFLGDCSVTLPANVAGSNLENKIFYSGDSRLKAFSIGDGSSKRKGNPCPQIYGSLSRQDCKKIWIETPLSTKVRNVIVLI
ncbi:hypothetical protein AQUCO_06100082v1 [Aquilegia coerulea]|uniref:Uncharacterized protein n=1 Tax=Aquilegia coerulea TaxID=218851 RepID=A0A2G5CDI4_AQUCA|nr:hypothetical protein AQUCO_06100082v1 [Aquilegia coerulea]